MAYVNVKTGMAGVLALLLTVSSAFAQADSSDRRRIVIGGPDRYYAGLNLGLGFLADADNTPNNQSLFPADRQTEYESGASISALVGYRWMENIRLEGEISYYNNEFSELGDFTQDTTPRFVSGYNFLFHPVVFVDFPDIDTLTVMANVYRDFDIGGRVKPFLGVGGGAAFLDVDDAIMADDSDTTWAAQLRAGLSVPVEDRVAVTFGYRLLITGNPQFADEDGNRFKSEYTNHGLEFGVRAYF